MGKFKNLKYFLSSVGYWQKIVHIFFRRIYFHFHATKKETMFANTGNDNTLKLLLERVIIYEID